MVRLAARIDEQFPQIAGPRTVWTIGRMLLEPNAPSVVPGRAEMQVQFRDTEPPLLDLGRTASVRTRGRSGPGWPLPLRDRADRAHRTAADGPRLSGADRSRRRAPRAGPAHAPAECEPATMRAILSERMPAGMMFIPSLGGIAVVGPRTPRRTTSCSAPGSSPTPRSASCVGQGDPRPATVRSKSRLRDQPG